MTQRAIEEVEQVEESEVRHSEDELASSVEVESASVEAPGLQETLDDVADGFDVSGFKCVSCGLVHGHDTAKHRASDAFDGLSAEEAAEIPTNPVGHCGVQYLARNGSEHGVDEGEASRIAQGAPIPDEAMQELNDKYGHPA